MKQLVFALLLVASPALAQSLDFDLTTGIVPAGLSVTRTGGTVYVQTDDRHAVATTSAALYDYRSDGARQGMWIVDAYTNRAPSAFGFSTTAGWTSGGATITADDATAPDGTLTADRVTDGSVGSAVNVNSTGPPETIHSYPMSSVWIEDYAASPPTIPGGTGAYGSTNLSGNRTGTAWRRIAGNYFAGGAQANSYFYLYPAGVTPIVNAAATLTASATGSIEAWGALQTTAQADVPLLIGSTTATTVQATGSLTGVVQGTADFDVSVSFISDPLFYDYQSALPNPYLFAMTTADGESAIWVSSQTVLNYEINGVTGSPSNISALYGYGTREFTIELFSKAGVGAGLNVWANGCRLVNEVSRGAAVTMHAPSVAYLGSNEGAAQSFFPRRYTGWNLTNTADPNRGEGVILGDSISAPYLGKPSMCAFIYSAAEARSRPGIINEAYPGQTIAQQTATWQIANLTPMRGNDAQVKWVIVQLPINDAIGGRTEAQMVADMNTLIADINTHNPSAKIILAPPTPCRAGIGDTAWAQLAAYIKDVEGTGSLTITGSNITRMPAWTVFDDGSGNLAPIWDSGDGVHDTARGRQYQGAVFRAQLQKLGLL